MTYVTCHQELKAKHFCPLLFGIRVCRKTMRSPLHRTTLCSNTARSTSVVGASRAWPEHPPGSQHRRLACTHSSCATAEGFCPSSQGTGRAVGLARSHVMHTVKQNKGVLIESEAGKDIPTQGDKPSTACQGSLSLVRKCSRLKSILLQPRGGEKNVHRRLSFSVIYRLLNTKMALKLFI